MADSKITGLDANTTPLATDLLPIVDDPGGTAVLQKMEISSLLAMAVTNVTIQTLTAGSGNYTPTTGMKKVLVILVGPGGAGGSVTGVDCAGGGGGGGGTCIRLCTAAEIGSSKAYVVGTPGNATTLNVNSMSAGSGSGGSSSADSTTLGTLGAGGAGGAASGGDINVPGQGGRRGIIYSTSASLGGDGGNSVFGGGGAGGGPNAAGSDGGPYGGGGGGGACSEGTDRAGGAGANGVAYFIEFLNV
jgi:hypothetical protein